MLTAAELYELTGYRSPAWQAKWLAAHGWKFELGRDGPKVLRAYRDARMGPSKSNNANKTAISR
tara:strand:+ start:30 stop:221 length:192 start_codon:yes stop_codon:yes gene_type:complete